ncbi:putative WD repeat-containing protein [Yarrowia sp. B02]|nr:putative WD repeat-containing protein [Yarrowia sp. B02]
MNVSAAKELQLSSKEYVLAIAPVSARDALAVALSDNSIYLVSPDLSSSSKVVTKAHERLVGMKAFDQSTVISWGDDGVKLWDLREQNSDFNKPLLWMKQGTLGPIVSCDFKDNIVAGGSELVGTDAGICLWNVTNPKADGMPFIEFPDVHNDDVTELRFHPTRSNIVVSGSTDGLVNVYDTTETDQDEVVKQVFNHDASIHCAGFVSPNRVYVLSHMETLSIYDMDFEKDDVAREPLEFGDVRSKFGCEYVADIVPGYVISGSNNAETYAPGQIQLLPFKNETVTYENAADGVVTLNDAHGTEVVRAVYLDSPKNAVYTGGEDGYVRLWNVPNLQLGFGDAIVEDTEMGDDAAEAEEGWQEVPKKEKKDKKDKDDKEKEDKKEKREKREKKEKRKKEKEEADKKDKKKKEKKEKKDKKDKKERFAPY